MKITAVPAPNEYDSLYVSDCRKYRFLHRVAGFGMDVVTLRYRGDVLKEFAGHTALRQAQDFAQSHALEQSIPETTFANYCEVQR